MRVERVVDDSVDPPVRGFLHRPASPNSDALVLAHSAGGNSQSPLLVALAGAFAAREITVLRCDLPFRQLHPHGPPLGHAGRDREGLRNALTALKNVVTGRVFLGGHSYGGRQASMLAAEDPDVTPALLLLSYPLHPPGRPAQLRTAHFPKLRAPALFVSGTRDEFASIEEITSALKLIAGRSQLLTIEGEGHSLGGNLPQVAERVFSAFCGFVGSAS